MILSQASSDMIEELRESGMWCCVKLDSDYMYVWDVILYEAHPRNDGHKPTIKSGSKKDLNDAVKSAYDKAQAYIKEGKGGEK